MSSPSRICPQCGIPLASNEMFCNNCGTRYAEQAVGEPAQYASSSSSSSFSGSPFDNINFGSTRQGTSPKLPMDTENKLPPQSSSPSADPSPFAGIPGVYGQPAQLSNGYNQSFQSGKSPNRAFIIGIILLLALVIGGGVLFFVKSKGGNTNVIGNGSTSVPVSGATTTPTSIPLFFDNFADNSKGWGLASSSGYSSTISNNMMTLADSNHKILDMAIPISSN